jgi:hypothetical protein
VEEGSPQPLLPPLAVEQRHPVHPVLVVVAPQGQLPPVPLLPLPSFLNPSFHYWCICRYPTSTGLFLVKVWGVPFFHTGRKKKQGIRVIYGILGVQKATKSLKRAFWVRSEVFKAVITYLRRFLAIFVGFF